jgi:hypothetical protein
MTAEDLIGEIRSLGLRDLDQALGYIADHLHECRLKTGSRILDQSDFKTWLLELGSAIRK